jgi:hypothetical protein
MSEPLTRSDGLRTIAPTDGHVGSRRRRVVAVGIWALGLSPSHPKEGAFKKAVATDVIASSGSPQKLPDPATFQRILHDYRTGRAQDAINELAAWPVDRLADSATMKGIDAAQRGEFGSQFGRVTPKAGIY